MSYIDDLYRKQQPKTLSAQKFISSKKIDLIDAAMNSIKDNLNIRRFEGYYNGYDDRYCNFIQDISKANVYKDIDLNYGIIGYRGDEDIHGFIEREPGDGGCPQDTGLKNMNWELVRALLDQQIRQADLGFRSYEIKIIHKDEMTPVCKRYAGIFGQRKYIYVPNRCHYIWMKASW